ncbi:MAG: methyltransferase [Oscillospiraceae bacterium]|jgi:hypothetical protein|nr:methyltransferase [Oscillospiraceae bacterium]
MSTASIPFDPKEISEATTIPGFGAGSPTVIFKYPVSPREGYNAVYRRKPLWQVTGSEQSMFSPKVNPDNIARAFVFDASGFPMGSGGGPDMFGIEWEYVPQVGGSMVRPGKPFIEDANEIAEKLVWPDIEKWDWEENAKANAKFSDGNRSVVAWFLNGWYERLISFMDFEGAIMAVFDEDQKDAVKDFFSKLSDLYIKIFDKYLQHFPFIDGFCIHDDWGSQKETFFSPAVANEMIVPYMRRVTDYLHSRGKYCDLHSCGQAYKQIPNFIAGGWDSWSGQNMNDTHKIYEEYGDKILVGVTPEIFDPSTLTEDEQRERAREYAEKFCRADKPSIFNYYGASVQTRAYSEELYKQSRMNYSK